MQENVSNMLKFSTRMEANTIPGCEAPRLVIDEVIKLERKAMRKRMRYLVYFTSKQERELERRERAKKRKAKRAKQEAAQGPDRV